MKKIAIIGYGRFGQLITDLLLTYTKADILVVSSKLHDPKERVSFVQLKDIESADVVIPVVPISAFEKTVKTMLPFINHHCLFIDVCSVKSYPVKIMKELLPETVSILATHPMFGPDSFQKNKGLSHFSLVMYPVRIQENAYNDIRHFAERAGLVVREINPDLHDKYAAYSQLYSFIIGNLTNRLHLQPTPIDTFWFSFFLEQSQAVTKDGNTLFQDMITYNPYAERFITDFNKAVSELLHSVEKNNHFSSSRS